MNVETVLADRPSSVVHLSASKNYWSSVIEEACVPLLNIPGFFMHYLFTTNHHTFTIPSDTDVPVSPRGNPWPGK